MSNKQHLHIHTHSKRTAADNGLAVASAGRLAIVWADSVLQLHNLTRVTKTLLCVHQSKHSSMFREHKHKP